MPPDHPTVFIRKLSDALIRSLTEPGKRGCSDLETLDKHPSHHTLRQLNKKYQGVYPQFRM